MDKTLKELILWVHEQKKVANEKYNNSHHGMNYSEATHQGGKASMCQDFILKAEELLNKEK